MHMCNCLQYVALYCYFIGYLQFCLRAGFSYLTGGGGGLQHPLKKDGAGPVEVIDPTLAEIA